MPLQSCAPCGISQKLRQNFIKIEGRVLGNLTDIHPQDLVMSSHTTSWYLHTKVPVDEAQKANGAIPTIYII